MKQHLFPFSVAIVAMALTTPTMAVDLVNEDLVRYEVVVQDADGTRTHVLRPEEALPAICYRCNITVEGAGPISTEPGDTIVIRNRSFRVSS